MNITDMLESQAVARGDAPLIVLHDCKLSFRALDIRVWQLSAQLQQSGVERGDVVAHTFADELDLFCCMLATARIGATVFSLPQATLPWKREQLLADTRTRHLATDVAGLHYGGIPTVLVGSAAAHCSGLQRARKDDDPSAPWVIVIGSGTTGASKLIAISHRQQWVRMMAGKNWFPNAQSEVFCSLVPLDFFTTKMRYLEALTQGTPIAVFDRARHGFTQLIDRFKATTIYGTVMHAENLIRSTSGDGKSALASLGSLMVIGSTVSMRLRERLRGSLGPRLYVLYGTNESGTVCVTHGSEVYDLVGTVGRPQGDFRLEVVDGDDVPVPAGTSGQVRIQGPAVIGGYLDDASATGRSFRDGWFYPGDLGQLTPDGQLIHLGRSDDLMIVNGVNLYPAEIEQVLVSHPAVREAAALALKHEVHQDIPVCGVALLDGARIDDAALLAYAQERLGVAALHRVVVLDRIPRNDRGKPDRAALKASIVLRLSHLADHCVTGDVADDVTRRPTLRQLPRLLQLVFDVPLQEDLKQLDAWLAGPLQIELGAVKDCARFLSPQGQGPNRALAWLSRCLLLSRALLQASRVPVFDTPGIRVIEPMGDPATSYRAQVMLAQVDAMPLPVYETALNAAFSLGAWALKHKLTTENQSSFYAVIQDQVIAPLSRLLPMGKSSMPVLAAAFARGLPFQHLALGVFQLGWGARAIRFDRSTTVLDSAIGAKLSHNKVVTGHLLRLAGLPAPVHAVAPTFEAARAVARRIGWPVVVKPVDRDRGEGVTVDVVDDASLKVAFEDALQQSKIGQAMIERQVEGVCYRLFVARGQLLYAVRRLPMSVTGDGRQTVAELVAHEFEAQQRLPPWMRSPIKPLDPMALLAMGAAGYAPASVPGAGARVPLRRIESTEWGGVDEEVTHRVHPENLALALAAATLFGLDVAGIDIISPDISQSWHDNGAILNEVNFSPLLGGGEISRRNIPRFLDQLLPNGGRIPVELFVGGANALRAAVGRWQALRSSGLHAVLTNDDQTWSATGDPWPMPFRGVYQRTRALTLSPRVEGLVVVIRAEDFARQGLPLEAVDAVIRVDDSLSATAA